MKRDYVAPKGKRFTHRLFGGLKFLSLPRAAGYSNLNNGICLISSKN
jgi:hypothetical protein